MDEKEKKQEANEHDDSIEKLLAHRQKIDAQLKEKYSQNTTVMFTDIKGSTSFFETYGDIEGRLMVQKHNEMLFPLVEKHQGRVIKTIGDAIMAAYEGPEPAVRSAIEMQNALFSYNAAKKDKKDQIHVRIGINTGEGLVEKSDIYGDVVNVAARVESLTDPDEILISQPVYESVRTTDDILCRYAKQTKVKGKEEAIDVYRVVWGDEEAMTGLTRGTPSARSARKKKSGRRRLEIDISRDGDTLKITSSEKSGKGESTIRPYEEMQISMPDIDARCKEITGLLNRANTRGQVSKDILSRLRDVGNVLFDTMLSSQAKETLRKSQVDDLVFHIEDSLVQIPWELLYDGEQFLCQKFNMGRVVKTRHTVVNIKQRQLSRPLKMLIVSDPRGDLENSASEGRAIREQLDANPAFISANQRMGQITPSYIMEKVRNFDLVHYAGHADYDREDPSNSGWLLDGGKFTSADIMKLVGGRPMPAMVFCNACQSGQTEEWKIGASYNQQIFGLANAFLLSGVQHYIGTFWEILDAPGARFAEEFYKVLLEGATVGEAVRLARTALVKEYGEDTIVWASYMLYGDPAFNYFDFALDEEDDEHAGDSAPRQEFKEAAQLRSAPSETIRFDGQPAKQSASVKMAAIAAAVVLLIAGAVYFMSRSGGQPGVETDPYLRAYQQLQAHKIDDARRGFEALAQDDPRRFEGLAAVLYELGDFKAAQAMCARALALAPYNAYAPVIQAHMLFSQSKLDEALALFQGAADRKGGIAWQKAEALNGIARIYSSRGDTQKAAEYYARAAELNPNSSVIFSNQAFAMQRMGDAGGALAAFQKAAGADPGDRMSAVMLADAQRKQQAAEDKDRRERIDKLVDDLVASFKSGAVPAAPADTWTSRPLSISFMGLKARGAPPQREGEDEFFMLQLSDMLQESGRVQVVERELLDKLLEELKLSSTDLVNRNTALQLGRIVAARVIATGSIMRYGADVQLSLRLTDTETTRLVGAVSVSGKDIMALVQEAVDKLAAKLQKGYPIRARVVSKEGERVLLNAGAEAGLQEGMEFTLLQEGAGAAGVIKIASVQENGAAATVVSATADIAANMKVQQIVQ